MPTVALAPTAGILYQAFTNGGLPLNAGYIYTYGAGGTTPKATYTTSAGNVANANPIVLDASGRPPSEVWLIATDSYRFDVYDSTGSLIKTYDNVPGIAPYGNLSLYLPLAGGTMTGDLVVPDNKLDIVGSVDATKILNFEVDGISTATTRVITVPDASFALPSLATITTAGDMWQASASSVMARLALGLARQVPTVNAGATALAYQYPITLTNTQATTSGTAFDFTGLPAGIRRITMMFFENSLSGTDSYLVQLGNSGGLVTTGYVSSSAAANNGGATSVVSSTSGFIVISGSAGNTFSGSLVLNRPASASHSWVASHAGKANATSGVVGAGYIDISSELDRVRLTRTGTDTFDAGGIVISYE